MKNETNNTHDLRKFGIIATQGRSHISYISHHLRQDLFKNWTPPPASCLLSRRWVSLSIIQCTVILLSHRRKHIFRMFSIFAIWALWLKQNYIGIRSDFFPMENKHLFCKPCIAFIPLMFSISRKRKVLFHHLCDIRASSAIYYSNNSQITLSIQNHFT